jgi:type VI secretion system protein ImpK
MTGKPPFDPMEAGDRTVIRPNPGGRRQAPAPQPAPSEPAPAPGASPAPSHGAFPGASGEDAWLSDSGVRQAVAAPPPPVPAAGVRSADLEAIRALDVADVNPVVRAARPLMMLLANLRVSGSQQKVAPLMDAVAHSITEFERDLHAAGVSEDTVHTAKYVMCATADDIVQNIPGSDRHVWTQHSMLSRFFQMRTSGVGFFDELAKAKANPALHYNLLELMHACLSLGFEGQYRSSGGGDVALQQIRRDVYHTLRHIRPRVGDEISPHWRGQDIAAESALGPRPHLGDRIDRGGGPARHLRDPAPAAVPVVGGVGDYLYDLPWYVIIGPPGAGKTTALVNSGPQVPARPRRPTPPRSPAPAARATATGGSPTRRC